MVINPLKNHFLGQNRKKVFLTFQTKKRRTRPMFGNGPMILSYSIIHASMYQKMNLFTISCLLYPTNLKDPSGNYHNSYDKSVSFNNQFSSITSENTFYRKNWKVFIFY